MQQKAVPSFYIKKHLDIRSISYKNIDFNNNFSKPNHWLAKIFENHTKQTMISKRKSNMTGYNVQ